jgi:hypothetical protein
MLTVFVTGSPATTTPKSIAAGTSSRARASLINTVTVAEIDEGRPGTCTPYVKLSREPALPGTAV